MKKIGSFLFTSVLAISLLTACSSSQPSNQNAGSQGGSTKTEGSEPAKTEGFAPSRDVEFVVPYSAGGGSDLNARTLAQLMSQNKFVDQKLLVINKEGGSGAVGNAYTFSKKGDDHTLMTWGPGQQVAAVVNKADVTLEDLTPIATVANDTFLVVVKADSPYKTFEEFVEASKAKPDEVTVGGAGIGQEDSLIHFMINRDAGTKLKYVTFNSGGDTMSALMGGHIDSVITNPNEIISQIEAGEARAIAAASAERLAPPLDQVPTLKELGYPNIVMNQFRAVVGPPDMPAEAVKYWEDVFKKVAETKEWQENYIDKNNMVNMYLNAEDSKKLFEESLDLYLSIHKELGTLK